MADETIVLKVEIDKLKTQLGEANAAVATYEQRTVSSAERMTRKWELQAAAIGKSPMQQTLARQEEALKRVADSPHAERLRTAFSKINAEQERLAATSSTLGARLQNAITNPMQAAGAAAGELAAKLGPVGLGLTVAAAGFGGIAAAVWSSIKSLGEYGHSLHDVSIRTGLTTREVAGFSFAAKMGGTDVSAFEMAMRMLSKGLADNSEAGKNAREGLTQLGVKSRDVYGNLRPMSDVFLDISRGLNQVEGTANRNAVALKILGRAGLELIPTLLELEESLKMFQELGLAPSDMNIKQWQAYFKQTVIIEAQWDKMIRKGKELFVAFPFWLYNTIPDASRSALAAAGTASPFRAIPVGGVGPAVPGAPASAGEEARWQQLNLERVRGVQIQRGTALVESIKARQGATLEGLKANLSDAQSQEKEAWGELLTARGSVESVIREKAKAWETAHQSAVKYETQVKAIEEAERRLKQGEILIAELRSAANVKEVDFSSVAISGMTTRAQLLVAQAQREGNFMRETLSWLERIERAKLTGAQQAIAYTELARVSTAEYTKESEKLAQVWERLGIEARKFRDEVDNKDIAAGIKKSDEHAKDLLRAIEQRNALLISSERGDIERRSNAALRMVQAESGRSDPRANIEQAYAIRKQLAVDLYDYEVAQAEKLVSLGDKSVAVTRAWTDEKKMLDEAELSRTEELLQLDKARFESLKRGFEGLFDAALAGAKSFWDALKRMAFTIFLTPVKEYLGNLFAGLFAGGGQGATGGAGGARGILGGLGGLLGGGGTAYGGGGGLFGGGSQGGGIFSLFSRGGGLATAPGGRWTIDAVGNMTQLSGGSTGGIGGMLGGAGGWAGLARGGAMMGGTALLAGGLQRGGASGNAQTVAGGALAGAGAASMLGMTTLGGAIAGAGFGLAAAGLQRGGLSGLAMSTGGGALVGWQFGGPLGAAIGAGIGAIAGIVRLFIHGAKDKVQKKIKALYGINVTDKGVLDRIVAIAKQNYGGNLDMAIRAPDVRDLIELYAMSTGQSIGGLPAKMQALSMVQSGGALSQVPTYSNGVASSPANGTGLLNDLATSVKSKINAGAQIAANGLASSFSGKAPADGGLASGPRLTVAPHVPTTFNDAARRLADSMEKFGITSANLNLARSLPKLEGMFARLGDSIAKPVGGLLDRLLDRAGAGARAAPTGATSPIGGGRGFLDNLTANVKAQVDRVMAAQAMPNRAASSPGGLTMPSIGKGLLNSLVGSVRSQVAPIIMMNMIKLDGPATVKVLRGEALEAIKTNPRTVQGAIMSATKASAGRREMMSLQMSPGLLTS